jgi:hypothetical protein
MLSIRYRSRLVKVNRDVSIASSARNHVSFCQTEIHDTRFIEAKRRVTAAGRFGLVSGASRLWRETSHDASTWFLSR